MEQFAGYGFNKSHSAAYALLAYQTAYLKTHYPVEFMAALLTSVSGSTDDVVKYINECREMGIAVEPPDVNVSDAYFTPHGEAIRFGLAAVRMSATTPSSRSWRRAREAGAFTSIFQFCEKVDLHLLNKRVIESLIKSGAMDASGPSCATDGGASIARWSTPRRHKGCGPGPARIVRCLPARRRAASGKAVA